MFLAVLLSRLLPPAAMGLLLLMGQQQPSPDATSRKNSISPEARDQVRKVIPAVGLVMVRNEGDSESAPRPRGSAVIVNKDGLVITNFHVVARDRSTRLYDEIYLSLRGEPGNETKARMLRMSTVLTNPDRDLALLKIIPESNSTTPLPYVELAESSKIELLDDLFIIGYPEKGGTTVTVNYGVVEGKDAVDDWIKTDARIIHGNSGGAAVDSVGKLVGIPTRVVADSDGSKTYGSVGYLRPASLVAAMISKYREAELRIVAEKKDMAPTQRATAPEQTTSPEALITIRGTVKSKDGKPLAGVRVGLLPVGQEIAASNLITWGGSNAEGQFQLEKPVAPGRYNLRAKVIGYELYDIDIEIGPANQPLIIELKASQD